MLIFKTIIHIRACFFTWGKARGVPNGGWATVREYEANSIADNSERQNSMLVCLHIRGQGQCQILDNY
jgi:hypothetical protein